MDFPSKPLEPCPAPPGLAESLGATPVSVGQNRLDYLVELESERLQQEAMYALAATMPPARDVTSPVEAARANVAAYEMMRAVAFPTAAVDTVLTAFAKLEGE